MISLLIAPCLSMLLDVQMQMFIMLLILLHKLEEFMDLELTLYLLMPLLFGQLLMDIILQLAVLKLLFLISLFAVKINL